MSNPDLATIDRRAFVSTMALGLLAAPLAVAGQQPGKVIRIDVLANAPPTTPEVSRNWEAFRQGLREQGWVEADQVIE